jgi:hypothetical protein
MRIVVAAAILGLGIIPAHANDELEFCAIVINAPAGYIVLHDGPGSEFGTRAKLVVDDFLYAARAGAASGTTASAPTAIAATARPRRRGHRVTPKHPPGPPMDLGNMREFGARLE